VTFFESRGTLLCLRPGFLAAFPRSAQVNLWQRSNTARLSASFRSDAVEPFYLLLSHQQPDKTLQHYFSFSAPESFFPWTPQVAIRTCAGPFTHCWGLKGRFLPPDYRFIYSCTRFLLYPRMTTYWALFSAQVSYTKYVLLRASTFFPFSLSLTKEIFFVFSVSNLFYPSKLNSFEPPSPRTRRFANENPKVLFSIFVT